MMRIGYFGDGPWAHKAFRKLNDDKTIEIAFVSVRYDKRDPVLLSWLRNIISRQKFIRILTRMNL